MCVCVCLFIIFINSYHELQYRYARLAVSSCPYPLMFAGACLAPIVKTNEDSKRHKTHLTQPTAISTRGTRAVFRVREQPRYLLTASSGEI